MDQATGTNDAEGLPVDRLPGFKVAPLPADLEHVAGLRWGRTGGNAPAHYLRGKRRDGRRVFVVVNPAHAANPTEPDFDLYVERDGSQGAEPDPCPPGRPTAEAVNL